MNKAFKNKSAPKTKDKKDDRKEPLVYKKLSECEVGQNVNFYGVVLSANFPHKSYKSDKIVCTLQVSDQSSEINREGAAESVSVVFFASKFADLPISQRVGEILRVHRAQVGNYNGNKQMSVNICYNSSWAIFAPQIYGGKQTSSSEEAKATEDIARVEKSEGYVANQFFGKTVHFNM
jgi:hypothetical protein